MSEPFTAELHVERYLSGLRIDTFLCRHFRNYTDWRMHRIVRAGAVRVNDVPVELAHRVRFGQRVTVRLVEPPDKLLVAEEGPLEILYEDAWLLVANKPPGLIVHPVGELGHGTLCNRVQGHLDRQTPVRGLLRPGMVHRLDRETSGVIVLTKEHLSHRLLSIQFQKQRVSKTYLALAEGVLAQDAVTVTLPIGTLPGGEGILMSCRPDARDAAPAKTRFEVIERLPGHTLVRAKPATGRMHQIRVHLAAIGHPIVADEFYGPGGQIKTTRGQPRSQRPISPLIPRHALHAHRLAFTHPITEEWCEYEAPLPPDLRQAIERVRG